MSKNLALPSWIELLTTWFHEFPILNFQKHFNKSNWFDEKQQTTNKQKDSFLSSVKKMLKLGIGSSWNHVVSISLIWKYPSIQVIRYGAGIHTGPWYKFYTYVTKTPAKLTAYRRKPENYNGSIIFEIDIMKKSSPINLNICQTWLFLKFFGCFFCFDLLWSWAESAVSPAENKWYFGFVVAKMSIF